MGTTYMVRARIPEWILGWIIQPLGRASPCDAEALPSHAKPLVKIDPFLHVDNQRQRQLPGPFVLSCQRADSQALGFPFVVFLDPDRACMLLGPHVVLCLVLVFL